MSLLIAGALVVALPPSACADAPPEAPGSYQAAEPENIAGESRPVQNATSSGENSGLRLKGTIEHQISPLLEDAPPEELSQGSSVNLTLNGTLNSEVSQVGDEVMACVSVDVKDGQKIVLPGQWRMSGRVTRVEPQRRLGRDGYVEVKFDKLISPDGKLELPIDCHLSTRDSLAKSVVKHVAKDAAYVTTGAVAGALLSVQLTGIPLAIASHGYSVAGGAAIGAGIGAVAAARRKGRIRSLYSGEEASFRILKPVTLPAFNPDALPSAEPVPKTENLDLVISKTEFRPDPFGDKRSRLLKVEFQVDNRTDRELSLSNIVVMSDRNQFYYPYVLANDLQERSKRVPPNTSETGSITFGVDGPKHKYWLVLFDRANRTQLTRVPVN